MKKYSILLLVAVSLFVLFGLISATKARKGHSATRMATNSFNIIILSHTEVFKPCKIGYVPTESCPDTALINVAVRGAHRLDGGENEIKYEVSGGRIIGEGNFVKWDLSGVEKAGYYTITVDFVDFYDKRQTKTEAITVRNCDCPNDNLAIDNPTAEAEIEKIELDKEEIVYPCPYSNYCPKDENFRIKVQTAVRNPKNALLTYQYTVSGGRIIGQGEKVIWDLKNIRPGTYTITAAIDEGRGFIAETKSKIVTVKECPICDLPCVPCPTLSVTGGGQIKAGETVSFTLNTSYSAPDITYNWTVSQGEIIEGQGTRKIIVKTTSEMTGRIKATVEINSKTYDLCEPCPRTAFEYAEIIK